MTTIHCYNIIYIYIYIYIYYHYAMPLVRIYLTLSLTSRVYRPLHSAGLEDYILRSYRAVVAGRRTPARPCDVSPLGNLAYGFVLTSLAVSRMSCFSELDGLQLLFCGILLPGFFQYSS